MASETRAQGSLIGNKLGGYQVEALVGRGAMGSVYLARDTKLNRHVALKVLLGSLARTPSIVKQFHQEAQSAAPLNHPNIVRIYSAGTEAGTPYIAMEFVDGEPLDRFLKRKGKVSWDVALHIGAQVALALDCAHQHGIVHRDVKPSNILVDRKGGVRLTDFGIARAQSSGTGAGGPVVGTPQYMSPEQATGADVFPASDLFSLGVTLYQMIAGDMPFKGESSMALIQSICEDDPPRLNKLDPTVPDDVARLVAYLLAKDPSDRPASAKVTYGLIHRLQKHRGGTSVVAESLTAFLQEEMEARPFSSLERKEAQTRKKNSRVKRKLRRRQHSAAMVAQAVLIALLAAAAFAFGPLSAARSREKAPPPAAILDLTANRTESPGVQSLNLFADGHAIDELAWLGTDGILIARTRGVRGSLADGVDGLFAIDTMTASAKNLSAPAAPANPTARTRPLAVSVAHADTAPAGSPFDHRIPLFTRGDDPDTAVVLAQPWDAAAPHAKILLSVPASAAAGAALAVSPSGSHLAAAILDTDSGQYAIVERALDDESLAGTRRTSPAAEILPGSLTYTPDGSRIAYLRRNALGEVDLWVMRSGAPDLDGRRIASHLAESALAFDAKGDRVVLLALNDAGEAEVSLLDLKAGAITATYGPGHIAPQAWTPDGANFIFAGPDDDPQLMLASTTNPSDLRRLTTLRTGAGPAYAISPDGTQIATAARNQSSPSIYLINLATAQQ